MKHALLDILFYICANIVGFLGITLCYMIGMKTGTLPEITNTDQAAAFHNEFFRGSVIVWLCGAAASLAWFAIKAPQRAAFLAAPIGLTVTYGLYVLFF